jgi:dihydrolipoamide dehydrogenase
MMSLLLARTRRLIAAERAGARGKSVLLIEKAHLGGVCTNEAASRPNRSYNQPTVCTWSGSGKFGVRFDGAHFDLAEAMAGSRM